MFSSDRAISRLLSWLAVAAVLLVGLGVSTPARARPSLQLALRADAAAQRSAKPSYASLQLALRADAAAQRSAKPSYPPPDRIAKLQADIAAVLARTGVPGAGVALVDEHGTIWAGGVGKADTSTGAPVTGETLFRVASVTKSFIALAVVHLAEAGALDLDAPLFAQLPDVRIDNRWHDQAPVTLAHALEHTAGFDDMRFNESLAQPDVERLPLLDVLAINPRSRRVRWQPGTRHAYANPGYTVAAAAIERATGEPFETVVGRDVIEALGIGMWSFALDPAIEARLAQGYLAPNHPEPYHGLVHRPAGSLMLSSTGLAELVHFWLTRGASDPGIVSQAGLARIERQGTMPYAATDTDYGLGNYGDVAHGVRARGHDGGLPGFLTCYRYFPELGVGYVMLLNATHSRRAYVEIRQLLFEAVARDRRRPPPPARPTLPPEVLDRHVGFYELESPRHEIFGFLMRLELELFIERDGDHLVARLGAGSVPLVPTGPDRFRLPGEGGTTVQFVVGADGRPALTLHNLYFERRTPLLAKGRRLFLTWAIRLMTWAPLLFLAAFVLRLATIMVRRPLVRLGTLVVLAPPAAAGGAFWAFAWVAQKLTRETVATANATSIGVFVLSLLFAANAALAVAFSLRLHGMGRQRRILAGPIVRTFAFVASAAAFGLTVYGMLNHLVGLRTWAW